MVKWHKTIHTELHTSYKYQGDVYLYTVEVHPKSRYPVVAYKEDGCVFNFEALYEGEDLQKALEWCEMYEKEAYERLSKQDI